MAGPRSRHANRRPRNLPLAVSRDELTGWLGRRAPVLVAAMPFAGLGVYLIHAVLVGFDREGVLFRALVAGLGMGLVAIALGVIRCSRVARRAAIALAGIGLAGCSFVLLITLLFAGQSRDVGYVPAVPFMLGFVVMLVVIELLAAAGPDRDAGGESRTVRRDDWVWRDPPPG